MQFPHSSCLTAARLTASGRRVLRPPPNSQPRCLGFALGLRLFFAIVAILLYSGSDLGAAPPVPGADRGPDPASKFRTLLSLLSTKVVAAQIERRLFPAYRISGPASGGLILVNRHEYSRARFPVTMGRREEWPPAAGGSLFLLARRRSERVLLACHAADKVAASSIPSIQRVALQSRIWDVFDTLYRDGVAPANFGKFNMNRWRRVLDALAATMRRLAVRYRELAQYRRGTTDIPAVAGVADAPHWAEFYDKRYLFVHDLANGLRRSCHVYLYDPNLNLLNLPKVQLRAFLSGRLEWSVGSAAIFEEDAIAITRRFWLVPTHIPVLVRYYRTSGTNRHRRIVFKVFRLADSSVNIGPGSLAQLGPHAQAWAAVNLPSIPGHGKPGFRCAISVSCLGCHSPFAPKCFDPGIFQRKEMDVRFLRPGGNFTGDRSVRYKSISDEAAALRYYWNHPPDSLK